MQEQENLLNIVADIGGTNARFACALNKHSELMYIQNFECAQYPNILDAIQSYLTLLKSEAGVDQMCLAVAGPIEHDFIDLPNNHWSFSRRALEQQLGFSIQIINDFTAQLLCAISLEDKELEWLGDARPSPNLVVAALGPGTGLGVAGITPNGEIIPSEGGHLAFAPTSDHQVKLLEYLWAEFPRVSVERILSGSGLAQLYRANTVIQGLEPIEKNKILPHEVTAAAAQGDKTALASINDFVSILGAVAGEVAIALGARGGVYLAGGILPHIEGLYSKPILREHFNAKGRFTNYCSDIPLALLKTKNSGLKGCLYALQH